MEDWNDKLLEEETEVHAKWLQGFLRKFKKPEISPSWTFRDTMKRKLNKKIKEKKEAQERVVLASIPSFAKWRFRFTGFVSAICAFVFIFILSFFTDFFSYNTIFISKKYTKVESLALPETLSEETSQMEKERVFSQGVRAEIVAFEQVNSIEEEESYLYDGKHYPKVAKAMPVYKYTGILGNEETLTKQLKSLKFGQISLKNIEKMLPAEIIFRNPEYPLNSIGINATKGAGATLTFEGISVEETYATMKEKELFKQVEKLLNSFDIPLRHYGNPQIARADEFYINMFYPFLIQEKYPVWSTFDHPLGITVVYNITLNEVSITAIDIAKYEYVNYPTLSKEEILKDFSLSGEKLVAPELIYLVKHLEGEMYYVPGLRFALENGAAVYKALVEL